MAKKGQSPEGGSIPSGHRSEQRGGRRNRGERVVDSTFTPFSPNSFIVQYYESRIRNYGTTAAVQKEFEADRWAAHLLVDSLPPGAPEEGIKGSQFFDQTVARLQLIDGSEKALVQAFGVTATELGITEDVVKMWYVTRDYDFAANGLEHPGDWIRHENR